MKIRHVISALALSAALAVAAAAPGSAADPITARCFNHSATGVFTCAYYQSGRLLATADDSGVLYQDFFWTWIWW